MKVLTVSACVGWEWREWLPALCAVNMDPAAGCEFHAGMLHCFSR